MPTPNLRPGDRICVVTGDVVASSALSPAQRDHLLDELQAASAAVAELLGPDDLPLPVDIYGGDSWQMAIRHPARGLRAALLLRAHVLAHVDPDARMPVDTRLALAIGTVERAPRTRVSEGEGTAFRRSGRAVTELGDRRMAFAAEPDDPLADWDISFRLLDEIVRTWTAKQARAMTGSLRDWPQERIAALWSPTITQPSVANHLRAARADAVMFAVQGFERRVA
jgi:hypothetical protein